MRCASLLGCALIAAFPTLGFAQELGLDLTAEAQTAEQKPDLRPTLAVLGVGFPEGVTPDRPNLFLAEKVEAALLAQAKGSQLFLSVLVPSQVRETLGNDSAAATRCADPGCLDALAEKLGAQRIIAVQQVVDGSTATVKLTAFARGSDPTTIDLDSNGPVRAEFVGRIATISQQLIRNLGIQLSHLKVTTQVAAASVTLDDHPLGTGSVEKNVAAGDHTVRVRAPDYDAIEKEISLEPGGSAEVNAQLVPRPRETASVAKTVPASGPFTKVPVLQNPGTYIAAAGVAVLIAGAIVGGSVAGANSHNLDANGDGVLDLTRSDALAARQNAPWATALMATGGGLVAIGGVTFFVAPMFAPRAATVAAVSSAGPSAGSNLGAQLVLAGAL